MASGFLSKDAQSGRKESDLCGSESGIMTPSELIDYDVTRFAQFPTSRGLAELTKRTHVIQPGFVLEA